MLWFLAGEPAGAGEPDAGLRATVNKLVEKLGDADRQTQIDAETALLKLGPDILPLLTTGPAAEKTAQGQRLMAVARTLKELVPRTFTLRRGPMSLGEVLDELAKQTGMTVADRRQVKTDVKVTLDLDRVTFWQAVDAIARAADAGVTLYQPDGAVALVDGPHRPLPVSYSGLFRVLFKKADLTLDLETGNHFCVLHLEVAWEPRFHAFLTETGPCAVTFGPDAAGKALAVQQGGGGQATVGGRTAFEFELRVPAPDRSATKIDLVRGSLSVIGPSKMLSYTFDLGKLNADTRKQVRDGVTVRLSKFEPEEDLWTVEMSLEYPPAGPQFDSYQSWLANNKIYLEKPGKRFEQNGGEETLKRTSHEAVLRYYFRDRGKKPVLGKPADWKLVYRTPGRIVEVTVPFTFKDLRLP
jgi:hypothetical protein